LFIFLYLSLKVPSVIYDTSNYLAIGRDTASICENISDVKVAQIEKSQISSINEECTSIVSDDLTNTNMLNYILNQANTVSPDSGRGVSLPYMPESIEIGNGDSLLSIPCYYDDTNQAQKTKQMSDGDSENKQILPQFHHNNSSRETISQMITPSSVSHPLPDHELVQNFAKIEASIATSTAHVLESDFSTSTQTLNDSKAAETVCSKPHTENDLNINLQNLMLQNKNSECNEHAKDDTIITTAKQSPIEVVDNDENDVTQMMKLHDNFPRDSRESTNSNFTTIMPGAYVHYDGESDKDIATPPQTESCPPLPDPFFTETEGEDFSHVMTGKYVNSDVALQQVVVSTCRVNGKVSINQCFCNEDVSTSAKHNVTPETIITTGTYIDANVALLQHIATSPEQCQSQSITSQSLTTNC